MSERAVSEGVLNALIQAADEPDSVKRAELHRMAQIFATESLADAVKECSALLKEVANRQIDATQELEATLKKATNVTVIELRKASVKAVEDGEAA